MDRLQVDHVPHDLVVKEDPVAAEHVARIGGQCLQVLLSAVNTWRADAVPFAIVGASSGFTDGLARLGVAPAELIDTELTQ